MFFCKYLPSVSYCNETPHGLTLQSRFPPVVSWSPGLLPPPLRLARGRTAEGRRPAAAQGRHEAAWSGEMVPFHVTEEE